MPRRVAPIYALILLQTLVWIAIVPLTPAFADEFGLSGVETGMILAAASLAVLVISFPVGLLVDRLGARRVTIACGCVFTLATLGQGLANEFWTLLLARALFGVAFGTLWAAATAWLSDSLTDERRAGALAATATVTGIGFTVGPVAAGVLADRYAPGTPFLVAAVAAGVVTATLLAVPPAPRSSEQGMRLRDGFRIARRDELVLGGIALIVLIGLVGGGINLLVPRQLSDNGVSAGQIGLLFTAGSAIYTVMSGAVARRGERWATLRVGGIAALATGATVVLVLLSGSTLAAVAFILLRAPFWSTMDTIIYPLAAAGAHRSALGRGFVMGLVMLGWGIASTLGPLVAGALTDAWSERAAYALMILWCALFGGWLLRTARQHATARTDRAATVDLDRLYGARDLSELRSEYDRIAAAYDAELLDGMGYRSPDELSSVVQRLVPTNAHILDAGAGTGAPGVGSRREGLHPTRRTRPVLGDVGRGGEEEHLRRPAGGTSGGAPRLRDRFVRRGRLRRRFHRGTCAGIGARGARPDHAWRRARHLHAPIRSTASKLRGDDRGARGGETVGARRAWGRVPGASHRRARGSRPGLGFSCALALARRGDRGLEARSVGEELLRVVGFRVVEHAVDEAALHDPALVHHRDLLRRSSGSARGCG